MIVVRNTILIKNPGTHAEVVKLLKEALAVNPPPHGWRIYTNNISPHSRVIYEAEFENLAEMEAHNEKGRSLPGASEWWEKWFKLVATGGGNEVYNLVD